MIRMAKIADDEVDGGGNPGGGLEPDAGAGTGSAAASGTDGEESARKRGAGGSLRGRGGVAIGRNALAVSFAAAVSLIASVGSDGIRAFGEETAVATSGNEGLDLRRIGGG